MTSTLEIWDMAAGRSRVLLQTDQHIEAPNWSPCGGYLLVNGAGKLFRVDLDAPALVEVDLGGIARLNNDHGISPDGKTWIFSSHHRGLGAEIYQVAAGGGTPELVSPQAPSWWHGVNHDGSSWTYVAVRDDSRIIDVYRFDPATGLEQRLTQGEGQSDGPDFSADGSRIYYNCDRSGHAQIWVMQADGSDQRQLFADDHVNWFPHPSPCGSHLIYLAYPPQTQGHPAGLPVTINRCDLDGGNRQVLAMLHGGQGTMNVPNWAPDGSAFAFMRFAAD